MVLLSINYRSIKGIKKVSCDTYIRTVRIVGDSYVYSLDVNGSAICFWATDPEDLTF